MQSGICGNLEDERRTFGLNGVAALANRDGRDRT